MGGWEQDPDLKRNISTFVTDRNKSVANYVKGRGIAINYDVWHLSKSIRKKNLGISLTNFRS